MKFVYVLVSSENDYITEQTVMSIYSLKKHNPDAEVVLVVDEDTFMSLTGNRVKIKEYVNNVVIADTPKEFLPIQRSRDIKTSLPHYIDDDFLYIDNDTVITGSLCGIEDLVSHVGAVLNHQQPDWNNNKMHSMLVHYYLDTGVDPKSDLKITKYYNGGVILCKNTPKAKKFFDTWHELWMKSSCELGFHKDQPDMWRANILNDNVIEDMDGIYNCQLIYFKNTLPFFIDAKIIHYFTSSENHIKNFEIKQPHFLKNVKTNGITEEVEKYLQNIKYNFLTECRILVDRELDIYQTTLVKIARYISSKWPFINSGVHKVYKCYRKMKR